MKRRRKNRERSYSTDSGKRKIFVKFYKSRRKTFGVKESKRLAKIDYRRHQGYD